MTTRWSPLICSPARTRHPSTSSCRYWPRAHLPCSISLVLWNTLKFTILLGEWYFGFVVPELRSSSYGRTIMNSAGNWRSWCVVDCGTVAGLQIVIFSGWFELVKPRAEYGSRSAVRALSSGDEWLRMLHFQVLCDHVVKLKKICLIHVLQPFGLIPAFQDGDFTLYGEH